MKLTRTVQFNLVWPALVGLINVLFLVVLFFALSSTFVLQPGVQVQLPSSPFALRPQRNPAVVTLEPGENPTVWFREQRLTFDELGKTLDGSKEENRTLIVRADRSVRYDTLTALMNVALQRGVAVVLAMEESR